MNNYFSDFISRFGGETLGLTSYSEIPDIENSSPRIGFISLYNPSWAKENDESFEGLSKQILFFITPQTLKSEDEDIKGLEPDDGKLLREQLNIIGLIRGSCSLLSDFGLTSGPITLQITDGAIITIEIEDGYSLAISFLMNTRDSQKSKICVKQLIKIVQQTHRMFELIHSPFSELLPLYGKKILSEMLRCHWLKFFRNFNFGADVPFGPAKIPWPNRLNHRGFFELFPTNSYKRSCLKIPESSKREIDYLFNKAYKPSGYLVANFDEVTTKNSGVLHMNLGETNQLDKSAVIDVYKSFEDVYSSQSLNSYFLSKLTKSEDIYSLLRDEWQSASESMEQQVIDSPYDESDDEEMLAMESNINSATILAMLNPVKLTNSLVVSPLHGTARGFKKLGLAVTEQIYEAPNWLNKLNYFGSSTNIPSSETHDTVEDCDTDCSGYLFGLVGNHVTRFLVNIPTVAEDGTSSSREYSVVVYKHISTLTILFYESGIDLLDSASFYSDLENQVCQPLSEIIGMAMTGSSGPLSNSIGSLPGPIDAAIHGNFKDRELIQEEIDSDFFFIIYDTKNNTYQTSLPNLQVIQPSHLDKKIMALNRIIFHLHDHLISHFIIETNENIFVPDGIVYEQLHKFSSSKHNDWLFYAMRHKEKVIIIIRNSNQRTKTKPSPTAENTYLMNVADSVYGVANLGFLENLGGDVRIWLGGVGKDPEDEIAE